MSTLIAERNEGTINLGDGEGVQYADVTVRMEPTADNFVDRDKVKAVLQVEAEYVVHGGKGATGTITILVELGANELVYLVHGVAVAQ